MPNVCPHSSSLVLTYIHMYPHFNFIIFFSIHKTDLLPFHLFSQLAPIIVIPQEQLTKIHIIHYTIEFRGKKRGRRLPWLQLSGVDMDDAVESEGEGGF